MKLPIYMDNHATTPVDPRVRTAMVPYLEEDFGNAASRSHVFGWRAEAAVELARKQVAALLGCSAAEIVFTSGATESNNIAIKGASEAYRGRGDHIVTVQTEHRAVLDVCRRLEHDRSRQIEAIQLLRLSDLAGVAVTPQNAGELFERYDLEADDTFRRWSQALPSGARVTYLPVDRAGCLDLDQLKAAITERTFLVSVMLANNEIGTIHPVAAIGRICRERGVLFHCDAVQGIGKVPFQVDEVQADLVSVSAHKIYGPKGVGALYVRRNPRVYLAPLIDGGGHERGLRSGTLNVAGIVGFGKAAELARAEMPNESRRIFELREKLRGHLFKELDEISLNGSLEHRLPGNLNTSFAHLEAGSLMRALRDVAVSSGSACTSASVEPSYVLRACGVPQALAESSIRFGLGRFNTEDEVNYVGHLVVDKVRELRKTKQDLAPLAAAASETC